MNTKKKRLGRGLDALLAESIDVSSSSQEKLVQLPLTALQRGQYQPRTNMDSQALEDLAESIKARGVVQPIVARELPTGSYEIIAGERRWRASKIAGLKTVPVIVRSIPDEAALAISLIENIQREDLNPIEEAAGLRRLLDEFELTHEKVAKGVGRSRSAVTNLLRLLTLNPGVKQRLEKGELEMGHARALLALEGNHQDLAAKHVVENNLSVRETEDWVQRALQKNSGKSKRKGKAPNPDVLRLQQELSEQLGANVTIKDKNGRGKLIIDYHSLDELDGLLSKIR